MIWLARRFTMICLFSAMTGILAVGALQNASQPAYSLKVQTALPCVFEAPNLCAVPHDTMTERTTP